MKKTLLSLIVVIPVMAGVAFGLNITPTARVLESMLTGTLVVTSSIAATDQGFLVSPIDITAIGTSSTSPVMFPDSTSIGGLATTAISTGDSLLTIVLTTTSSTPASATFTVTLKLVTTSPTVLTTTTLYVATGSPVTTGVQIFCQFDTGASLHTPLSYTVTVQRM